MAAGGGGGLYGGKSNIPYLDVNGGGAGSSGYIGGVTDGSSTDGQNSGNGKAKITYMGIE